jgi:hypothetical protein
LTIARSLEGLRRDHLGRGSANADAALHSRQSCHYLLRAPIFGKFESKGKKSGLDTPASFEITRL